jgi:hypothetical protein
MVLIKYFTHFELLILMGFLLTNFHKNSTWKMWFQPIQRIFHGKNGLDSSILRKKFKLLNFYNKF